MQRELSRREPDLRLDQFARESARAPNWARPARPASLQDLARTGMEEVHADFFENRQRCLVDRLQLVARYRRHRLEGQPRLGLRLGGAARLGLAALASPPTPASRLGRLHDVLLPWAPGRNFRHRPTAGLPRRGFSLCYRIRPEWPIRDRCCSDYDVGIRSDCIDRMLSLISIILRQPVSTAG